MKRFIVTLAFVALTTASAFAQANVQIIHNCADPAATTVDVWVNGNRALDDFAYRTATPFIELPAGVELSIVIAAPDSENDESPLFTKNVTLEDGKRYAVIASGVVGMGFAPNTDPDAAPIAFDLVALPNIRESAETAGNVKLFAFHGATDAPKVDVLAGISPLISGLSYGSASDYISVPPASYTLAVAPAGGNPIAAFTADLSPLADVSLIVVASGFLNPAANQDGPAFGLFAIAPTGGAFIALPPADVPSFAQVQIIHNSADPGAQSVDIYLGEDKIVDDFAFRTATPFVRVPAATALEIGVAPPNSMSANESIATFPVTLEAKRYVVVANGVVGEGFAPNPDERVEGIGFNLYPVGDIRPLAADQANVEFIIFHGASDAPSVDVTANSQVPLANDLVYGANTDYISVPAASYTINVAPAGGTPIANFTADLTSLAGQTAFVVASGFLDPMNNNNGAAFGLFAATSAGGDLIELPATTVSVEEAVQRLPRMDISPNPTSEAITLDFDLPSSTINGMVQIVDVTGAVVKEVPLGNLNSTRVVQPIETLELPTGSYYVVVSTSQYRGVRPLHVIR